MRTILTGFLHVLIVHSWKVENIVCLLNFPRGPNSISILFHCHVISSSNATISLARGHPPPRSQIIHVLLDLVHGGAVPRFNVQTQPRDDIKTNHSLALGDVPHQVPQREDVCRFWGRRSPEDDLGCDVERVVAHHVELLLFVREGEEFTSVEGRNHSKVDDFGCPS